MSAAEQLDDGLFTAGGLPVVLRAPLASEVRWIQATWSRSLRRSNPERMVQVGAAFVQQRLLARAHGMLVNELVDKSTVLVAAMASSPLALAGWVVFDRPVLHYVFVAAEARRLGLGTLLVEAAGCSDASHTTDAWRALMGST